MAQERRALLKANELDALLDPARQIRNR